MLTLAPVDDTELAAWLARLTSAYVEQRVAVGEDRTSAEQKVARQDEKLLPGGLPGPGQHFFRITQGEQRVGWLWLGADTPEHWWVYAIEIEDGFRGQGFGRAAMLLAEDRARAEGATQLGLSVFAENSVALSLYESLGYRAGEIDMRKALVPVGS